MSSHILYAYALGEKPRPLSGEEIGRALARDEPAWVHLQADDPETRPWLERTVDYLDQIVLDALLAEETRPRALEIGNGVLLILRGVNLNEGADPEDMVSIRLWIDPHRIISLRLRSLKAVQDIAGKLEEGRGPQTALEFKTTLVGNLLRRMEPVLAALDDQVDDLEEQVIEEEALGVAMRRRIIDARRQAIVLRRYIGPQREALSHLKSSDLAWIDARSRRLLQEHFDRITRYVEDLDAIRERAQIIKDELASIMADRMNRNLYILSLIAAIFLPLSFLTGLLGINVGGMPGADDPTAFWFVTGLCTAILGVQFLLFRLLKWL